MVVTLSSVYQVIRTNMIPSYRTINRITQLIVYAGNNSVVVILVGTDGHGHDNIHTTKRQHEKYQRIVVIYAYAYTFKYTNQQSKPLLINELLL